MQHHRSTTALLAATALALAVLTGCAGGSSAGSAGTAAGTPAGTPASTPATTSTPAPTESEPTESPSPSPTEDLGQVVEITVAKGKVSGPKGRVKIEKGSKVTLQVTSDVADEVHLHGYDKSVDVAKGETAELTFTADVAGVFEVELEQRALQLTQLQVQ